MNLERRLAVSYYQTIGVINKAHQVYLVQHQETKRIYVKKILDVYNLDVYQKLCDHPVPGTPMIQDYCEIDDQLILIEEYVSGVPLSELIEKNVLSLTDIYFILSRLCSTLERLHTFSPSIIHRDIKPSNILITNDQKPILLDFNAAKEFTPSLAEDTILLGTQGYAAPEQYGFGPSSPQTDIYSLGVVLKEMLNSCFQASDKLEKIAEKCTQLEPKHRFSSVAELRRELLSYEDDRLKSKGIKSLFKLLPPGYRTHTPWKILLSTVSYLVLFAVCFSIEVEGLFGMKLWIERFFILSVFLAIIAGSFNYLNIQKFIPICQHPNRGIRYLGISLLDMGLVLFVMMLLLFIESTIFPLF